MSCKKIHDPDQVRRLEGSFRWIDHRFITGGFLQDQSTIEILIYIFLLALSESNGISFYHDDRISSLLKISLCSLGEAREGLIMRSLISNDPPLYQVLSLHPCPVSPPKADLPNHNTDNLLI